MPRKRAPKRGDPNRPPKAFNVEPRVGTRFVSHYAADGSDEFVVIQRVIREGSVESDGSQAGIWTVEEWEESKYFGTREKPIIFKSLAWILFDDARGEWVRAKLYHKEKEKT